MIWSQVYLYVQKTNKYLNLIEYYILLSYDLKFQYPQMFGWGTLPGKKEYDRFKEIMNWVDDFIKDTGYVAGTNHLTLADICFSVTYSYEILFKNLLHCGFPS